MSEGLLIDDDMLAALPVAPYLSKNGYWVFHSGGKVLYVHRFVAERCLGRPLPEGALVHHVDYNKQNNRRSNLVICPDDAYHQLLHRRTDVLNAGGNPNTDRICCTCKQVLNKDRFSTNKNHADGIHSECRECSNTRRRGKGYNYWGPRARQQQRDRRAAAKAAK